MRQDAGRRAQRRDEIDAALLEERDRFVVEHRAVLDRIDAGAQRVLDALRADRVGGDAQSVPMRFVDRGGKLVGGELRVARHGALGHHAAGRDQLDAIGAGPHLLAHRLARVPRRIDGAPDRPAVAAGHAQHRAGGAHPRTRNPSFLDRIAHVGRDCVRAADVANRRDAGLDRLARVLDGAQHSLIRRRRLDHAHHVRLAAAFEMGVRVDETRRHAGRFEIAVAGRRANLGDCDRSRARYRRDAWAARACRRRRLPARTIIAGLLSNRVHAVPLRTALRRR